MENESETQSAVEKTPINYEEKIAQQKEIVKKLTAAHSENPSADSALELDRATDLLHYYINATKENPKERASHVAELAQRIMLSHAVQQMPVE